jgi:bacterioferritin-associated ferredoxin
MIVCHCNRITDRDIERAVTVLVENGAGQPPTPECVYGMLGKRMRCAGCLPHAVALIAGATSRCAAEAAPRLCLCAVGASPQTGLDGGSS